MTYDTFRHHAVAAAVFSWMLALLLASTGCSLGMFFPTSIDAELDEKTPLRGPVSDIRTIAIALPSMLEANVALPDSSRGKLDKVALDIGEQLEDSKRFAIVSRDQFQAALADQRREPDSLLVSTALTEADQMSAILKAARQVRADAVLMFDGKWETPLSLGDIKFGRPEFKRQVTMTLVAAGSGQTIWHQEATVVINESIATPQEPAMRRAVASRLTKDFLSTLK